MSFDFTENITLYLPEVDEKVKQISEATATSDKKLIIEIAAIHEGLTSNYNHYPAAELEKALESWVKPYAKPIIINHDQESDPLGRVMAAKMDKEADGTPFVRLQVAITNPSAVERVMDERYLTGSVGGKAEHAKCSICGTDWVEASGMGLPCKHTRGKIYNGKLAYMELSGLSFKEYSFVNVPADQKSGLRAVNVKPGDSIASDEGWIKAVNFYTFNMSDESIFELCESEEDKDILANMKKKDAHYTYMNVKGTFLTVSAYDSYESDSTDKSEKITFDQTDTTIGNESRQDDNKETNMSKKETTAETTAEDILSIVEQVSADAAATADDDTSTEETEEETKEEDLTEDTENTPTSEEAEDSDSGESEESATSEEQLAENTDVAASEELADTDSAEEGEDDERDLEIAALKEENAKLKKAMHFMLVERVVDAKIAVGMMESADRASALEDHKNRTAASLADSLRDLAKMPRATHATDNIENMPKVESNALVTGVTENSEIIEDSDNDDTKVYNTKTEQVKLEERLTAVLMGKKKA